MSFNNMILANPLLNDYRGLKWVCWDKSFVLYPHCGRGLDHGTKSVVALSCARTLTKSPDLISGDLVSGAPQGYKKADP